MPKPNGNNELTRDKLKLRDVSVPVEDSKSFEVTVQVKGPDFKLDIRAEGSAWIVRKVLQDLDSSIEQLW